MPTQPLKQITFGRGDSSAVVAAMVEIAAAPGAGGWVNIGPALTDEQVAQVPPRSGLAAWFSGRGPAVAMGTWMPGSAGTRPRAAQVGVEHGHGPNALKRLREAGLELPHGWQKRQDHARGGIVIELRGDVEMSVIVEWIIDAVTILTPDTVLRSDTVVEDRFIAAVYRST